MKQTKIIVFKKKFLNFLLILIAFFSILTAIDPSGRTSFFLTLSPYAWDQNYFWQFFSYIFLLPHPSVSIGFILRLAINLYIFWFCASFIIDYKGTWQFFFYFFFLTVFSAAVAFGLMLFKPFFLFGLNILICSAATAWLITSGNVKIHMALLQKTVQAKWLVLNLIVIRLFYDLYLGAYSIAILDLTGVAFTYFYILLIWHKQSPFTALDRFEYPLTQLLKRSPPS